MTALLVFAIGFVTLLAGGHAFVCAAIQLAARWRISGLVVGLTIVSIGTSLPEVLVGVVANRSGHEDVAVGNILGSNIANVLLVIGVAAALRPLQIQQANIMRDGWISIFIPGLVGMLALLSIENTTQGLLTRTDGRILILVGFLYLLYVAAQEETNDPLQVPAGKQQTSTVNLICLLIGAAGLSLGAQWVVQGTLGISASLKLNPLAVALTATAIGTSLPELVVSAMAAWRHQGGIAIGNVIGSNVFNLTWVLGLTTMAGELAFDMPALVTLVIVVACAILLVAILQRNKDRSITRLHGMTMLALYATYAYYAMQSI